MKFKKWRYNLIALGLVAIVGCYIGFNFFGPSSNGGEGTSAEEPVIEDIIDLVEEDPSEETEEGGFEDFTPYELLTYSMDNLYNGDGFSATLSQSTLTTTYALGSQIKATQYCMGYFKKNKTSSLEEFYYYFNAESTPSLAAGSMQKNYEFRYVSGDSVIAGKTNTNDRKTKTYDLSKGSVETITKPQAFSRYKTLLSDSFNICKNATARTIIPKSAYSVIKAGKEIYDATRGITYKEITVTLKNDQLSDDFKESFGSTGQITNISYGQLKITLRVNLKNGKAIRLVLDERLTGRAEGFDSSIEGNSTYSFSSVNRDQTISCPQ